MRAKFKKACLIITVALLSLYSVDVNAKSINGLFAKDLAGTRWSGYWDCSTSYISFAADGTLSQKNGTKGTWKINGDTLDITLGSWVAKMQTSGSFRIAVPNSDQPGSSWEQCDPVKATPYLPKAWMDDSRWSEKRDCSKIIDFKKNGEIVSGHGLSGSWRTGDVGLIAMLYQSGEMGDYYFSRVGTKLVSDGGAYSLHKC